MPSLDLDQLELEARASESIASSIVLDLIDELRAAIDYADHTYERLIVAQRMYWDLKIPTFVMSPERRQELADAEHDSTPHCDVPSY